MSPQLDAGTRLYALIGEAIHNLPPRFVSRLEAILMAQDDVRPAYVPVHGLPTMQQRLRAAACHDEAFAAADAWRCDVRLADRKLRGLGAVLRILQKAQANTYDATADVPPGDTLVDELLLVGRELVDGARDALRGAV